MTATFSQRLVVLFAFLMPLIGVLASKGMTALVGAFFAKVVGGNEDRFSAAVITGAAGAYLTVASVSYGIWQNWWFAFAWVMAALTAFALRSTSQV